ncbi:MAG: glyceraldehyde 3-phosphate dehydrogenase NAD-binding domain-containing protein [Pseudomonadota bacterium]
MAKLAINGFGRIGRGILRAMAEREVRDLSVVAVNDLAPLDRLSHLLAFDSVHGRYRGPMRVTNTTLDLGFGPIRFTQQRDPAQLGWDEVDLVLECTGAMNSRMDAHRHIDGGAPRVLVSGPCADADRTVVLGVNDDAVSDVDRVISNASCTTNCLAPVVKVLDAAFGLETGDMTTVHCYTNSQPLSDQPLEDPYRGRAAALSMIPTTTSAIALTEAAMPHLAGKLSGSAIRVPTPNVSCIELKFTAHKPLNVAAINDAMIAASMAEMAGIIEVTDLPLVSSDHIHASASAIFAAEQTRVTGGMGRVLAWYDNEWGFANRMIDMARVLLHPKDTSTA